MIHFGQLLDSILGSKLFGWVVTGIAAIVLLGVFFAVGRCSADDSSDQAEQTTRSSDAVADAAQGAIEMLEDRVATEDAIDQIVTQTVNELDDAHTPEQVRNVVIRGVCSRAEHIDDPACTTKAENRQ